jgi:N6-adenosine-specific RNA methylase IME4
VGGVSTYRTIVVDPPWPQKGGGTLRGREGWHDAQGASLPMKYRTMSIEQIKALRIDQLARRSPDGTHLYLWTTNRFLPAAFDVLDSWGFSYSTTLVWAKTPMGGGLGGAYGISTEYILFARSGRLPTLRRVKGTWFNWKRPYDERGKPMHSAKPSEFYSMIEEVSPGPRLEVFARRAREHWDVWGDQAPGAVDLSALRGAA